MIWYMQQITQINELLKLIPEKPGVYQFYDKSEKLLYIGKAINLKKRVFSYFHKNHDNRKLQVLVNKIINIKHIVVENESDALFLENNLIKKHQPPYNARLKDDKTFPWICIKNEPFPRIFYTRKIIKDGSKYYGPYTSVRTVKTLLELIRDLYKLRTCSLNLTQENIKKNKFKVCLEYHIKNCKGPCEALQEESEYNEDINQIQSIVKGNLKQIIQYLNNLMNSYAEELKFEKANEVKEKIEILEKYRSKSTIVNPELNNIDVFSMIDEENSAWVNYLKVMDGAIVQVHSIEIKKKIEEEKEELLALVIVDIRERLGSNSEEIILPFEMNLVLPDVKITVPQRGDKKKLLELSERNLKYFKFETEKQQLKINPNKHKDRILNTIQHDLQLKELPVHIECFDNSNIQGTNPVAACVVFKNAKPAKNEYRHFNIKSVIGPDDFTSMEEVVYRRYKRLLDENAPLPQLIVIDGGKGQLNAAMKSLKSLNIETKIQLIGIAKRLEEIFKPGDSVPLYLDKKSESLKVIQQLRDEAHRFGITFHRNKRSANFIKSELENIEGIGKKSIEELMQHFKSIENIKKANKEELEKLVGKSKAEAIQIYFNN